MANTTLTADIILKESFRVLRNNTPFINSLKPQYDNSYAAHGSKEGESIRIKQPQEYTVRSGKTAAPQDNVEKSVTLSRSTQTGIDLKFSSAELTQDIERMSELYLTPACSVLASDLDFKAQTTAYQSTFQGVTLPATNLDRTDILNAGVLLDNTATPRDGMRCAVLSPQGQADLVGDLAGLFNNSTKISSQYDDGSIGSNVLGFNFKMTQNTNSHTTGLHSTGSTSLTNGVGVEAATTLVTDGWASSTAVLKKGDIFTIAGVNAVNPLNKQSTGSLKQFVATADGTSSGADLTISMSPALISTGAYQNIDALPADGAAVTVLGTESTAYPQNLLYHPRAFAFATVDLELPDVKVASRKAEDGVSMRFAGQWDVINDDTVYRLDLLHGIVAVEPRFAVRAYQP